jgi:catechol 2,3-dioxygenase-like lactoylglutathione lyase family enzyme
MLTALSSFSGFSVDNLEEARKFYVDMLALEPVDESMGLHLALPGGGQVFIYQKDDHQPATYTALNFVVENIDEAVEHLTGHHGLTLERYDNMPAPQDEKGILRGRAAGEGPDIAWFKDPAGNILSVIQN